MSEQEKTTAERIDSLLSRMSNRQLEVFLARGEGFVEGYKAGKRDIATVSPPDRMTNPPPGWTARERI